MTLFDLKPGEAGLHGLRRELARRAEVWDRPGYHYRGAGDFLLQHGTFWTGRELPREFEYLTGEPNNCFLNALDAARANPELRYTEGLYTTGKGHYTPHAWITTPDGKLVEVTYPTRDTEGMKDVFGFDILPPAHWSYCGVVMSELQFVEEHYAHVGLGMMDRTAADREAAERFGLHGIGLEASEFPLFRVPFDPTRKKLP